eukprot:4894741-Heterocapsa_arctica.AAC.1
MAADECCVTDKVKRSQCGDQQNLFQYTARRQGGRSRTRGNEPHSPIDWKHRRPCKQGRGQARSGVSKGYFCKLTGRKVLNRQGKGCA